MKVLWVSEVFPDPNSGAGGTELLMVEHLRKLGMDVQTIWASDLPRRISHGNLHYAFELPRTYWSAIRRAINQQDFDVVTVNLGQGYLSAKKLRQRAFRGVYIARSHGMDDHLDQQIRKLQQEIPPKETKPIWKQMGGRILASILNQHLRRVSKLADGYVVSSSLDVRYLESVHGMSPEQIAMISQAPSALFTRRPPGEMSPERLRKMLYVAGYNYAKGPHVVVETARNLLAQHPQMQLTWVCHEKDHGRVKNALGSGILPQVRILGWMNQEALVEEFDQCGIFLYPSLFDGFGKVFVEAMARGLCVIGTEAGGMIDILRHKQNGFIAPYNDHTKVVEYVNLLQDDANLGKMISRNAIADSRQYTWERVGQELNDFFKKRLLSSKNKQGEF